MSAQDVRLHEQEVEYVVNTTALELIARECVAYSMHLNRNRRARLLFPRVCAAACDYFHGMDLSRVLQVPCHKTVRFMCT